MWGVARRRACSLRYSPGLPFRYLCTPPATTDSPPTIPTTPLQQERQQQIPDVSARRKLFIQFLGMVLGGGLTAWVYLFGQFILEWPEPCQMIVDAGALSPLVIARIGLPCRRSFLWSGTVDELRCNVSIPVSGPRGSGVLHGRCVRDRKWELVSLSCQFGDDSRREDLFA